MIRKESGGYRVRSEKGKNLGGPYKSREQAEKRLAQVEKFKHMNKGDFENFVIIEKGFSSKNIGIIGTHHTLDVRRAQAALEVHKELTDKYASEGIDKDAASKKAFNEIMHTDEGQAKVKARVKEIKDKQLSWRRVRHGKTEIVHRKS